MKLSLFKGQEVLSHSVERFPLRKMPKGKDERGLGRAEPFSINVTL